MKSFIFGLAAVMLSLSACGPRDVAQGGRAGGVSAAGAGKPQVIEKDGERSSTCPEKNADYGYALESDENAAKIYSGDIRAAMTAGDRNCSRIGATIALFNSKNVTNNSVKVKVTKAEIIAVSGLTSAHASAMGMTLTDLKKVADGIVDDAKAGGKFDPKGMVNLTYFEVVKETLPEGTVTTSTTGPDGTPTGPVNNSNVPSITILTKLGERSLTCPKKNNDSAFINSPIADDARILNGEVSAFLSVGDRNCFRIGAEANLQDTKSAPVRARLLITRIEIVPFQQLGRIHAIALGIDYQVLKTLAETEIAKAKAAGKFDPKDSVNITFFELIQEASPDELGFFTPVTPGTVGTPAAPVAAPEPMIQIFDVDGERSTTCPEKNADYSFVDTPATEHEKIFAGTIKAYFSVGDRNCFRIGSLVNLQEALSVNPTAQVKAKLKVVRVEVVPVSLITQAHADALGMTLADFQTYAQAQLDKAKAGGKFDPKGLFTLTFYEVDAATIAVAPAAPAALQIPLSY